MTREKNRNGAVTTEYVLVLLLVIGLSASLVGFRGTLENVVRNASTSVSEVSTSVTSNSAGQSQTSSSLLQAGNDSSSNNTESATGNTSTSDNTTSGSSGTVSGEVSVTELYSEDEDGNKQTLLDVLGGLKTSFDSSNDFLSSISSSVSKLSYLSNLSSLSYLSNINNTLSTTNTRLSTIASNISSSSSSSSSSTSYSYAIDKEVSTHNGSGSSTVTVSKSGIYLVTLTAMGSNNVYSYASFYGYHIPPGTTASFYMSLSSGSTYTLEAYESGQQSSWYASVSLLLVS
jgi:hypothetical protein